MLRKVSGSVDCDDIGIIEVSGPPPSCVSVTTGCSKAQTRCTIFNSQSI